jgi:hypothetical protein
MSLIEGHRPIAPPPGVPVWDVDPYAADILRDPVPYYSELRRLGPLVYMPRYAILASGRYTITKEIFSDHTRFVSSRGVGLTDFALEKPWRAPSIILEVDPPEHTKARRVMARVMSPGAVAKLTAEFQRAADVLIDRILEAKHCEAVADIAEAYSVAVFPAAVGLRDVDRSRFLAYGAMVFDALGPNNTIRQAAMAHAADVVPWIAEQCRRENLEPEGFAAAIYACADDGDITHHEASLLVRSLLSAGIDTTVTAIGSALWALATNPDQFERLKADPGLARNAFEETLRLMSPVHSFCRTTAAPTHIAGYDLEEGTKILCVLAAANLDPDQWQDPECFDIGRRAGGHLAFGVGVHGCVGQNVSRAEGQAVLSAIARKVATLSCDGDPVWRPGNAIRALERLPLRLS